MFEKNEAWYRGSSSVKIPTQLMFKIQDMSKKEFAYVRDVQEKNKHSALSKPSSIFQMGKLSSLFIFQEEQNECCHDSAKNIHNINCLVI